MRIIVCVKQVLDPRGLTVNRKAEKVFVNREEYMLDPASKAALQAAATLKEKVSASNGAAPPEIVAISLGPDRVDDTLREALALGADRAIHLKDAAFDNADAFVVANALAAAIRKVGDYDLILAGSQSLDSGSGELAARLAEALDLPAVAHVVWLEVKDRVLVGVRAWGTEFYRVEVNVPAVASIAPAAFAPIHANGWRLMDAYKVWGVESWGASDLGLTGDDLRAMAMKKEDAFLPERQFGTLVKDASELATLLKRERVV
jgi:electron transfer flavoprotein beta subunit